jgi:uncharacterized iron-regulated membrane protein
VEGDPHGDQLVDWMLRLEVFAAHDLAAAPIDDEIDPARPVGGRRLGRPASLPPRCRSEDDRRLEAPVVLARAPGGEGRWTAKSTTANRPRRVDLVVDGTSGEVISRSDFASKHPIDQVVAVGIAFHEGRLFGWPNQLLLLLTTGGLVLVCVSAIWLWLRRRDPGKLGAPPPGISAQRSVPLLVAVIALGVLLPLFGVSLVVVLLLERLVLRQVPAARDWLGLV